MQDLITRIEIVSPDKRLDYSSRVMLMGSCFAENIGKKLHYYRFRTDVNPFGILYNPVAIANALKKLIDGKEMKEKELLLNNGKWVSLFYHGSFSSPYKEETLDKINSRLYEATGNLRKSDWLLLTFGTSWVYKHKAKDVVVGNCHKIPAGEFERYRLEVADIVVLYKELIGELKRVNPELKIVFTVSPIRHWKDGAHGNQLSKAVLLLAIEELMMHFPETIYFPSYELVMDELRDYRFYAEDMLHISETGISYVWDKFRESFISDRIYPLMSRVKKLNKGLLHRPLCVDEKYNQFLEKLREEAKALKVLEPGLNMEEF